MQGAVFLFLGLFFVAQHLVGSLLGFLSTTLMAHLPLLNKGFSHSKRFSFSHQRVFFGNGFSFTTKAVFFPQAGFFFQVCASQSNGCCLLDLLLSFRSTQLGGVRLTSPLACLCCCQMVASDCSSACWEVGAAHLSRWCFCLLWFRSIVSFQTVVFFR